VREARDERLVAQQARTRAAGGDQPSAQLADCPTVNAQLADCLALSAQRAGTSSPTAQRAASGDHAPTQRRVVRSRVEGGSKPRGSKRSAWLGLSWLRQCNDNKEDMIRKMTTCVKRPATMRHHDAAPPPRCGTTMATC
jgi:hypothetical protein